METATELWLTGTRIPRWRLLHDKSWVCPCCGTEHAGVFDICSARPEAWKGGEEYSPNTAALYADEVLSEDFCVSEGRQWFVRCVLALPIIGSDGADYSYGVWATVFGVDYNLHPDNFDEGDLQRDTPWKVRLANSIKGYPETLNLKGQLIPQPGRDRPRFQAAERDHPLAIEQENGITLDRLLGIYAINGHDIRAAYSQGSGPLH